MLPAEEVSDIVGIHCVMICLVERGEKLFTNIGVDVGNRKGSLASRTGAKRVDLRFMNENSSSSIFWLSRANNEQVIYELGQDQRIRTLLV